MKITILTLFPNFFTNFLQESIIKRAIEKQAVTFEIVDIREFSTLNNHQVDDTPYGGGPGMVMRIDVVAEAIKSVKSENSKVIFLTPSGKTFKQKDAVRLSKVEHLILLCGHYEGIDERILHYVDEEISIGDFVLTGGEVPAMVVSDAIVRLLNGVIKQESYEEESFQNGLLDYPNYTKPPIYDGYEVPEILLSGHHENIASWRIMQQQKKTEEKRPDLLK